MDEKKLKLKVLEKTEKMEKTDLTEQETVKPSVTYPNHTNPIYKKMISFHNEKIGDKWSIKDLLR